VSFVPGQPTVVVFASSWSDSELILRQVDDIVGPTASSTDVQALALMVKDSPTRARSAVDAAAVSYQVGLDAGGELAERYGVTRLPAVVTLDQQGLVVGRQQGVDDTSQVANLVDQLAQRTSRTTNGSN
jgi:thioredoxin-like negative regulator of GroEL